MTGSSVLHRRGWEPGPFDPPPREPDWRRLPLDAASPSDWLVSVALATAFGDGRWVPIDSGPFWGKAPFAFEYDGELPNLHRIAAKLNEAHSITPAKPPWPGWLAHRGQGTPARSLTALHDEINGRIVADRPIELGTPERHTHAAAGWMIDEHWRPEPGVGEKDSRGRPLIRAALALIGAHVATGWDGHWHGNLAVGHFWEDTEPDAHNLDCWVMTWRRHPRPGEKSAGALAEPRWFRLGPPTWQQHVSRHLEIAAEDVCDFEAVCALVGIPGDDDKKKFRAAAKAGKWFTSPGRRMVPPPVANVGKDGLVWDAAALRNAISGSSWEERLRLAFYYAT